MSEKLELLESVTFTEDPSISSQHHEQQQQQHQHQQQQQQHNINISVEEISITNATNTSLEDITGGGRAGEMAGVRDPLCAQDTERDVDASELPVDTPRTEDTLALNLHSERSVISLARGASEERSLGGGGGGERRVKRKEGDDGGGRGGGVQSLSPKKSLHKQGSLSRSSLRGSGGGIDSVVITTSGGHGADSTRGGVATAAGAPPALPPAPHPSASSRPSRHHHPATANETLIRVGDIVASLLPLQVFPEGGSRPPRAPTLHECAVIVRHLKQLGDQRSEELRKLKADLRDLLDSNKWSPDAFLLARAYVADLAKAENDQQLQQQQQQQPQQQSTSLPRIELRQRTKRLPSDAYVPVKEEMTLPALSQIMPGNKIAERKKRTQILQKARLHQKVPEATGL